MRAAAAVSAGLHGLLVGAVLVPWRWPLGSPPEAPAKIEMVFGYSARANGAAAPAASAESTGAPAPPPQTDGATPPGRVETAAAQPVRLGDGMAGFHILAPGTTIVEAQSDPGNRPPPPPEDAFARGEHGVVVLRIHVRPDGLVGGIETLQSSGYADLDDDAIIAARRWHFLPALRDGVRVASVCDQSFYFELR